MSDFDVNELKRCIRDTSNTDRFIESVQVNYDNVVRVTNRIYERSAKGSISCIVYLEDIIIANTDLFDTLDYNGKLSSIEYILNLLEEEFEGIEIISLGELYDNTLFNNILLEFNWRHIYERHLQQLLKII